MKVRSAAIIIENDQILSLRYQYGGKDVYCLPGGNLDFGETMVESLRRELMEELGIEIEVHDEPILSGEIQRMKTNTLHVIFKAKIRKGEPIINPKETSATEICWLSWSQLLSNNLYPSVGQHLNAWNSNKLADKYVGLIQQKWF